MLNMLGNEVLNSFILWLIIVNLEHLGHGLDLSRRDNYSMIILNSNITKTGEY